MAAFPPVSDEAESTGFSLTRYPPDRLLTLLAGVCAIGFGALSLVLYFMGESLPRVYYNGYTLLGGIVFGFAIAVVFGLSLLLAFATMEKRPAEGAILGLAFSVVLLAFGGMAGLIAGILGLVGALVGIVRHMKLVA